MTSEKCPKCGSRNFQIVDHYDTGYMFEVKEGFVTPESSDNGGEHLYTVCSCHKCNHLWHPKQFRYEIDGW